MISKEEANKRMLEFIKNHIGGIDYFSQDEQIFNIKKDGESFFLFAANEPVRNANKFIENLKEKGRNNTPAVVVCLRSTKDYKGKLLRPAKFFRDGKNLYYDNKKQLTKFEQKLVEFYGLVPYYNPSSDCINILRFSRTYRIPQEIMELSNSKDPKKRQKFHIHEENREKIRKISIDETIKDFFTLESYERKDQPLIARIVPYQRIAPN